MRILVTGSGRAGSWQIRGQQLGSALGATVKPQATLKDIQKHDLVVVVKRVPPALWKALRDVPWVFDCVDFYPQPESSTWSKSMAVKWVRKRINQYSPTGIVWPNDRMRSDCNIDLPHVVLPHHFRPTTKVYPLKDEIRTVGYEGREQYLGEWGAALRSECQRRGWTFAVNHGHVWEWDVVVSFRSQAWTGYVPRHWKSNVKLANAHAAGVPFIGQAESGYRETAAGGEVWCESPERIGHALDSLRTLETRQAIRHRFIRNTISIEQVTEKYQAFLGAL